MTHALTVSAFFAQEQIIKVPSYQRAYAWGEVQINQFLKDLDQHPLGKPYFFGTLLLETTKNDRNGWPVINVVDGQQRLTTLLIFFYATVHFLEKQELSESEKKELSLLSRKYLFDQDVGITKFETVDSDVAFFHEAISKQRRDISCEGLSQKRLLKAYSDILQSFVKKSNENIFGLCKKISSALIIPYKVSSAGEATQIFELQNDRGKKLTNLESLKAYLMHRVFLIAKEPDQQIMIIQGLFERIFRTYEKIEDSKFWKSTEDDILIWYAIAYSDWKWWNREETHAHTYFKELLTETIVEDDLWINQHIQKIIDIAAGFESVFGYVLKILEKIDTPNHLALTDLFALNKLAPFWPLLIKIVKYDESHKNFDQTTRVLEKFCMRAYAIVGMKSGSGEDDLFKWAREFNGNFEVLINNINNKSTNWRDLSNRFYIGLQESNFYDQGADARYFFWRYENFLRSQKGNQYHKISLKDYFSTSTATRFSIEHISAQKTDDEIKYSLATIKPYRGRGSTEFKNKYLHSIGNLVLDCHSPNASKGKAEFPEKVAHFNSAPFMSQNELCDFATKKRKKLLWDKDAIKKREKKLLDFAYDSWGFESELSR